MGLFNPQVWLNFLSLLPAAVLAVLTLAIAFLRFYDVQDFPLLDFIAQPRLWSNRFTVAALVAALVLCQGAVPDLVTGPYFFPRRTGQTNTFGVEWNRRNRETNRLAEAGERETRRDRCQIRCLAAQVRYQLDPTDAHRQELNLALAQLEEYQQALDRDG